MTGSPVLSHYRILMGNRVNCGAPAQDDMLNFKGMRFPIDVILVYIRWYAVYP